MRPALPPFPQNPANDPVLPLSGDEAPQVRIRELGSAALAPSELLALVLARGEPEPDDLALARRLMSGRSLDDLHEMAPSALSGLGPSTAQADALRAAFEIARRLARQEVELREPLADAGRVARYLTLRFRSKTQEVLGAIFLDGRRRVMAVEELFRGGLCRILAEPAVILREALARNAASLLLFHTHPSGDPRPSPQDIAFTRRVLEACELLDLELVDHLILGSGRWVSLKQGGFF